MLPSSPEPRLEPAARERVVELLSRHFANDVISLEEFESRLDRAYGAASASELSAVVADLPQTAEPPAAEGMALATVQRIAATLSGQEQRVTGVVPRRVELRSRLGYVEVDFTRATFAPGVTEIDIRAFMGYVQIRLPAGIRAECLGSAMAGFFALRGAGEREAPRIVRITGRAMFGFAECFVAGPNDTVRLPGADR